MCASSRLIPYRPALITMSLLLTSTAALADPASNALPTGGQITAGSGAISQSGNKMTVQQNTQMMSANWTSFDIGSQAHVDFQQPNASSVAVNRIAGGASQIFGKLSANGRVHLVNPNGIVFGQGAQVDVGGLVASALEQSDADLNHFSGNGTGAIINKGTITVPEGGAVAMIGTRVSNEGTINASGGSAVLAAGESVTIDFAGDGLIQASVDKAAFDAQVENKGVIVADGGVAVISAKSANALMNSVVNNEGIIRANGLSNQGGRLILDGGDAGVVNVQGSLQANGAGAGQAGGTITITGKDIAVRSDAAIQADGAAGGGKINIGGGWQGQDASIRHADKVTSEAGARITANATQNGDGGEVVLWSDGVTEASGRIEAKGGAQGGNGGRVETSGATLKIKEGLSVKTGAPIGNGGLWLLDPTYSVIDGVAATAIVDALEDGDVINSSVGSTSIEADIISGWGNNLSFHSVGQILVDAITISTGGGNLYFGGASGGNSYATGQASGQHGVVFDGSILNAGGGTITVNGRGYTPGDRSVLAQDVSANESAGKGVVFTGAVNFTGSNITVNGIGGDGQNVRNETNVQSTVSSDGDFVGDTRPALNNTSVDAGDGAVGVEVSAGANVTMTANSAVTINASGGDGGDAGYLHASSGGNGASSGSGTTGYYQAGNVTLDTPTATIDADGGYSGSDYGEGYWYRYFDQDYGYVYDPVLEQNVWQVVAEGHRLYFSSNDNFSGPATYGLYMTGDLTQTYSNGRVLNLISNYDARLDGVLTASYVMMRGQSDSVFRFENASNTLDRIAGEDIDSLYINHNFDTNDQTLHIGTVSGVAGFDDVDDLYVRVTSTGDTGAQSVLVQDAGAAISFGSFAQLTANSMEFNGSDESINSYSNGSIGLRSYDTGLNIVIGNTNPNEGGTLYIPVADLPVFDDTLNYLLIGGDERTGTITIDADADFNHNLSLSNGNADIVISGDVSVSANETIVLRTNGTATVTGALTAGQLALHGTGGAFDLTNTDNTIRRLSTSQGINQSRVHMVNTGDLNIEDRDVLGLDGGDAWNAYALETLDGNGVRASDRVYLNTTGNLVLDWNTLVRGLGAYIGSPDYDGAANINAQHAASVLLVAGGNFENRSNSASAISTNGANRFLVYSDAPNAWSGQSTNHDFKMYAWDFYDANETDNGNNGYDFDNGGFGRALPASAVGDGFLYSHQPTLTITALEQDGTYGDTPVLSSVLNVGYEVDGYIDGDDTNDNTGTAVFTTDATSESNVGTYDISYTEAELGGLTGIVPKYNNIVLGYRVVNDTAENAYTIDQRAITIDANAGQSMVYGDAVPTLAYSVTAGSLVNQGSTGALTGGLATDATSASDVGTGYTITQGTLDNANYDITYNDAGFSVTKRPVTITATVGQAKIIAQDDPVYSYAVARTGGGIGLVNGDGMTGLMARNPGEEIGEYAYTLGTLGIDDGNAGGNYEITLANGSFRINPAFTASSITSVQNGITGTSQTAATSFVASSVGPGTGASTVIQSATAPIVTNNTMTLPLSATPVSFGANLPPATITSSGATTTMTFSQTSAGMNVPLPEDIPLMISGKPGAQGYNISATGTTLSATAAGSAGAISTSGMTFTAPPASATVPQPAGGSLAINVRLSTTGVLIIEVPAGMEGAVDPQTTMLAALAVARETFGGSAENITAVYITPPIGDEDKRA